MAPTQPSHRTSEPTKSILKSSNTTPSTSTKSKSKSRSDSLFPTTKADKRRIKHANLISKIAKPTASAKTRRRRPSKKLVTTLDALADALPEADAAETGEDGAKTGPASQVNVISRKSMKSRPGALKRKQKLDNEERERFGKNLAQLQQQRQDGDEGGVTVKSGGAVTTATQDRWAALRGFIGETLERRPDVVVGKG